MTAQREASVLTDCETFIDGLIITGPTGTNVNDLYLGLIDAE